MQVAGLALILFLSVIRPADAQSPTPNLTKTADVAVLKPEIESITFKSDHHVLVKNNSDWSDSGVPYAEPECRINGQTTQAVTCDPISQTKSSMLSVEVKLKGLVKDLKVDLAGNGPRNSLRFEVADYALKQRDDTIVMTAKGALPDNISEEVGVVGWSIRLLDPKSPIGKSLASTEHKVYVTYGDPTGSSVSTEKRMGWCTLNAVGAKTSEDISDAIHNAVAKQTTFGGAGTEGWALLGGGSGDCDNQARLMCWGVELLGIAPASVHYVTASTNDGNCVDDLETRKVDGKTHYLLLYFFDAAPDYRWNAYEGVCVTAGSYYAVTPKRKESHDCDMLKAIKCQQYWVRTNVKPGDAGWGVMEIFEEVPKP